MDPLTHVKQRIGVVATDSGLTPESARGRTAYLNKVHRELSEGWDLLGADARARGLIEPGAYGYEARRGAVVESHTLILAAIGVA